MGRELYDLRFEHRPAFLVARVSAPKDCVEVTLGFLHEITAEYRKSHCHHVLIIEDIPTNLSTIEMHEVATVAAEFGLRGIIIAYVDLQYHPPHEDHYRETLAVNRGLSITFFPTVAQAEQWLESQASGLTPRTQDSTTATPARLPHDGGHGLARPRSGTSGRPQ